MYCKICGQDGPDDGNSCTYCGSPFDSKAVIFNVPAEMQIETDNMEPVSLPEPERNFSLIRFILCAVFLVLLAVLFCFPGFRNMIVRNFVPPTTLMKSVYNQSIENIVSQAHPVDTVSARNSVAAEYRADIQMGEEALLLLADALDAKPQDIQGLSDIQIRCDAAMDRNLLRAVYDLSLDKQEIIAFEQYVDTENAQQWLVFPELSNQAMLLDLSDNSAFSSIFEKDSHNLAQISPDALEEIAVYYTGMFINGFENVNKYRENVVCNGMTQRTTVLKAVISTRQLYETLIAIIDDASQNSDVAYILYDMEKQLDQALYSDFLSSLAQQKSNLQDMIQQLDSYSDFTLYTYLNRNNDIIGMELEYTQSGTKYQIFSYITVLKGAQFATEIMLWNGVRLQGRGTVGHGIDGNFSVFQNERLICDFTLTDFVYTGDMISGAVRITPDEEIVEHLTNQIGAYEAYLKTNRLSDFSIEIELRWNNEINEFAAEFYSGEEKLSAVHIVVVPNTVSPIIVPENALNKDLWQSSVKHASINSLIDRLENAGISRQFLEDESKINDEP